MASEASADGLTRRAHPATIAASLPNRLDVGVTMPRKLARSLGPRQLVHALERRDTLAAREQEVTFLAELDPASLESSDVWRYGNGGELGVFVFVEADGIAVERGPRPDDGHDPNRHPAHVWVRNAEVALPFERGVLVKDAEELAIAVGHDAHDDVLDALTQRRGTTVESLQEQTLHQARALCGELDAWRARVAAMSALPASAVAGALAAEGLQPFVVELDPEHLQPIVRAAVLRAADRLGC